MLSKTANKMERYSAGSYEEMVACGAQIARTVSQPAIIGLSGSLGSGKTTLAKGLIASLTGTDINHIHSPTFQYVAIYNGIIDVVHFDLWRLPGLDAFLSIGLEEFLDYPVILIEWPDRIANYVSLTMSITITAEETRRCIDVTHEPLHV